MVSTILQLKRSLQNALLNGDPLIGCGILSYDPRGKDFSFTIASKSPFFPLSKVLDPSVSAFLVYEGKKKERK